VLRGPAAETLVPGRWSGVTAGGNLSLIAAQLGVPGRPLPPPGAIGLIEDVDEDPYRVDHLVTHLLHAGWFDRVGGLALGSWHRCGADLVAVRAVLADRLGGLGVPIVWEHGFGHGPGQLTVPLGVEAELDAGAATLTLLEPALA
jgi:muramoyltetrapeptide carboxypeptidase